MSKNAELKAKRDKSIFKRYKDLSNKKTTKGITIYRHEAILEMLSNEWYLTPDWIGKIITEQSKKG